MQFDENGLVWSLTEIKHGSFIPHTQFQKSFLSVFLDMVSFWSDSVFWRDSLNVMLTMSCSWPEAFRNVHLVTDRRSRRLSFSLWLSAVTEARDAWGSLMDRICPRDHRKRRETETIITTNNTQDQQLLNAEGYRRSEICHGQTQTLIISWFFSTDSWSWSQWEIDRRTPTHTSFSYSNHLRNVHIITWFVSFDRTGRMFQRDSNQQNITESIKVIDRLIFGRILQKTNSLKTKIIHNDVCDNKGLKIH